MKDIKKLAALTLIALTLGTTSLFADNRRPETTNEWRDRRGDSRRTTVEGVIRDVTRDRNQTVIRLDRGGYVLVADRDDARRLGRGDFIRATGEITRGRFYVDRIQKLRDEDNRRDADDRYISGTVRNVDRRGDVLWVELDRSNKIVAVDVRRVDRNSRRFDVDDVRRGDRIAVRGDWNRNGRFEAERVDVDRGATW